ncbi:hypothetical protein Trydic_g19452 [Trypoxylus dichotomus]
MNSEQFLRIKIEMIIQCLNKRKKHYTQITKTLKELQTTDINDLQQSIENYKKSKENLLKTGKVQLLNQQIQTLLEEYETIRKQKINKQSELLSKLHKMTDLSQSKAEAFTKDIEEFVAKQREVLNSLDLKSLREVTGREKELHRMATMKIEEDVSLFDALKQVLKDRKVTVTVSTDCDDSNVNNDGNEIHKDEVKEDSIVILYKLKQNPQKDDLSLVRGFLDHLGIKKSDLVSVERIGRETVNNIRPLQVAFANGEVVNKLLAIPIGKTLFNGHYVRIAKFRSNCFDY